MKTVKQYRTRDGKLHTSIKWANSHALSHAHNVLKNLLDETCPYLENSYKISQDIINHDTNGSLPSVFLEISAWLNDANRIEED